MKSTLPKCFQDIARYEFMELQATCVTTNGEHHDSPVYHCFVRFGDNGDTETISVMDEENNVVALPEFVVSALSAQAEIVAKERGNE